MEIESYEAFRMDFKNLMSCIHYHEDSDKNEVVLETLKTIIDICSNESCGRDAFREEGGLDFLVEFLFMTDNTTFLEHTLKTLAFVIDENGTAQSLTLEIGLIQDLLTIYENCAQAVLSRSSIIISPSNGYTFDLWLKTNSALCFAVNNPQNEKNQEICMNIFPVSLRIMEFSPNIVVLNSISSFLSLTISNNEKCQDYFSSCDGFLILKRCLQKFFDAVFLDLKLCNNVIGRENLQAIGSLISIISAASLNHEENASTSGKLGILSMMIKLIFIDNLDCQLKTKIVLCLGHCIDAFSDNKSCVLETENFDIFLKKSFYLGDAELSSACKYLLHVCLINKGFSEADGNFAEYFNFASTDSIKEICIPKSDSACFDGNTALNKTAIPTCSLEKNSIIGSIKQTPKCKAKSMFVKSLARKSLSTSSSSESSLQSLHSRKKSAVHSKISINKLRTKKGNLSSPNTAINEFLLNQTKLPKCNKHLNCIHSNADILRCNALRKDMNNTPHSGHILNKQNTMYQSNKIPLTDFLSKETYNATGLQNQSIQCDESDFSQTASDNLTPQNNGCSFEKENNGTLRHFCNSSKEKFPPNRGIHGNSQFKMKLLKQNSSANGYPRLLKKKKNKMRSKRTQSETSSSSSEYSFCPQFLENPEEKENKFGYSARNEFTTYSPKVAKNSKISDRINHSSQNNDNKWNLTDMPKTSVIKPLFSSSASFQSKKDYESKFIPNLPSTKFENLDVKNVIFPKGNETFSSRNAELEITKNISTLTGHGNFSLHTDDESANRFSFSPHVSESSSKLVCLKNLDECYHSRDETIIPRTLMEDKSNKRKRSWDCSSLSIFNEGQHHLQSNRQVEVIVLSQGVCEEHGLSTAVELLDVVSLDEFNKHSPYL